MPQTLLQLPTVLGDAQCNPNLQWPNLFWPVDLWVVEGNHTEKLPVVGSRLFFYIPILKGLTKEQEPLEEVREVVCHGPD